MEIELKSVYILLSPSSEKVEQVKIYIDDLQSWIDITHVYEEILKIKELVENEQQDIKSQ